MAFDNLDTQIQKALETCNYTTATPVQAKAIPEVLAGNDVVASAQTGSGKTAAFVLPALHALATNKPTGKPSVLILTPTRELATQITTAARKYGSQLRFSIVSLVGGMSYDPQIRDLKRGADIIVATPGRLIDHLENKRVDLSGISMLVLDEADRMLDMGFIEDVEAIAAATPVKRQTLLFSATLDKSIIQIVKRLLKDPVMIDLSKEKISTPKIKQTVIKAKNMHHKTRMLKHYLNDENIFKAIIFSATKMNADSLANELRGDGFAAATLHGDLRQNVRNRTIDAFRRSKIQFLIATDVAARGLDINDITHVINYDLPKFCEDYVHRIGRTGRAGKTGEAISFCSSADFKNLQRIERYIGQRLQIQQDTLEYNDSTGNTRSDAAKFPPEDMLPPQHGRGGKRRFSNDRAEQGDRPRKRFSRDDARPARSFGDKPSFDKPGKRFDRDENRRFNDSPSDDKPRKRFDRDDARPAKSFGEKRRFDDKPSFDKPRKRFDRDENLRFNDSPSDDRPRKRFDRDDARPAKSFGEKRRFDDKPSFDKPRKRFDRDESRSFNDSPSDDRPRKRFDRDDARPAKSFGEKRRFDDRSSDERPRKRFDRDDARPAKSFGEKRRFDDKPSFDKPRKRFDRGDSAPARAFGAKRPSTDVFERPTYEFEQRDDNPKIRYKTRVENKPRNAKSPSRGTSASAPARKSAGSGKFTKKPFRETRKRAS